MENGKNKITIIKDEGNGFICKEEVKTNNIIPTRKEIKKAQDIKFKYSNCKILNLEASAIHNQKGNNVTIKKNKRYEGSFDNSLEMQELEYIYKSLKVGNETPIFYNDSKGHKKTDLLINLNFSTVSKMIEKDIRTNKEIINERGEVVLVTDLKTKELREDLYKYGFIATIRGISREYVKYKRSTGSARQGNCIFIWKDLYESAMLSTNMGKNIKKITKDLTTFDLPAYESYISLTMSSAIDTIKIPNDSIVVIDDQYDEFTDKVMETTIVGTEKDATLVTDINEKFTVKNNLWDGMSLLDKSVFGKKYEDKGFILVRNNFLKSACFNSNIQKWFKDNKITTIEQLREKCPTMVTLATEIKQIKMLTTSSSLKIVKFPNIMKIEPYLKKLNSYFSVIKYEKPTKFWDGEYVKTSYQLMQTLNMNNIELNSFLKPSIDYINELKNENNIAFKNHLKLRIENDDLEDVETSSNDEMILSMLSKSDKFTDTELFKNFKEEVIGKLKVEAKTGRILVKGTYAVMVSCPILMLKYMIGQWKQGEGKKDVIMPTQIVCTNFKVKDKVAMIRSPHICSGNLLTSTVVENRLISKYMNLTPNIVVVSSIKNNIQQILNSCDWDSDMCLITTSSEILSSIAKHKKDFLVPCTNIAGEKSPYTYCLKDMATMDSIASNSQKLIGQIVNFSANLNSLMFHNINSGKTIKSQIPLYKQICTLAIMSGLAIDGSKKTFSVDLMKELNKIRKDFSDKFKYETKNIMGKTIEKTSSYIPNFFRWLREDKVLEERWKKYDSTMDKIYDIVDKNVINKGNSIWKTEQLYQMLHTNIEGRVDKDKKEEFVTDVKILAAECKKVFQKQKANAENEYTKKTKDDKFKEIKELEKEFIKDKKHMNCLNEKTIEAIFLEEGHTDKYDPIQRKLINMLFLTHKAKFAEMFKMAVNVDNIKYLVRLDKIENVEELKYKNTDIIELFGIKHLIVNSNRDLKKLNANPKIIDISELIVKSTDKVKNKLKNTI